MNVFVSDEPVSELETMHKLHDDKMSKIQELKGKKEAIMLELQNKRKGNLHNTKDFEDLVGNYSTKRDQLFATLAGKSPDNHK